MGLNMKSFPKNLNKGKGGIWQSLSTPKQLVSFEELLMSQVVQQEALTRLLVEKGIFTRDDFLEMVSVANQEIKERRHLIENKLLF